MGNESSSGQNPFHDAADKKMEDTFDNRQNMTDKEYNDGMKDAATTKQFANIVDSVNKQFSDKKWLTASGHCNRLDMKTYLMHSF